MTSRLSPKERREWRAAACEGKQSFASPGAALRLAKKIRRRSDQRMVAYRCRLCRRWHLGHAQLRRGKLKRITEE